MVLPVAIPLTIVFCCGHEYLMLIVKTVSWELALDSEFTRVVQSEFRGKETSQARDHTVKIIAENLHPGQSYYYRFRADGVVSEPGRTRTLPKGSLARLGLAIASCSNFPFGFFNAYEVT